MLRRGCAGGFLSALLLICGALDAQAQPPVEVSGELEASVTSRKLPSDDKHQLISQVVGNTHLSTYLWKPWIATVTADLHAAFENNSGGFGDATSVAGDISLAVLPSSRTPFQLFFSASDNRFDGEYALDYTRMRAGMSGRVAFNERSSLDYLYSFDQLDRAKFGEIAAQRAEATYRHNFTVGQLPLNITDIGLSFNYYSTDFKSGFARDPSNSSESLAGTVFYRAAPMERVNHDFSATLISDKSVYRQDHFDRLLGQTVGTAQWRSPSNDVVTSSALRMMFQQIDRRFVQDKKTDTDSAVIAASAGASWRASDRLSMNFGARANFERIETIADDQNIVQPEVGRSNRAAGVLSSIDYRSLAYQMGGFNWHWDARAVGDLSYTTNRYETKLYEKIYGPRSDATVSIGHSFDRLMRMPVVQQVNFTFLQETGFAHYGYDEEFSPFVTHSSSLTKGFADENGASYVRLYMRDTHRFGDQNNEYQTAQADFTRQIPLGGNQSLHGSVGVQVVRQVTQGREDYYVFSPADLEYEYRNLFGVYGLSFTSTVRINGIGLNDPAHDWRDQLSPNLFRNDWRNRVQYRVGELWLSLEGTVFQVDGEFGHYARFAGRRNFDFVD